MPVKRVWRRDTEGYLSGAFTEVIAGLIIYKERRDKAVPAIKALQHDGKLAWERVFDRDAVRYFFPYGNSLYLEGLMARRLDAATGETKAERDLGTRVVPRPGHRWVIYRGEEPPFIVGLSLDTLDELWRFPDGSGWEFHDEFLCRYETDGTMQFVELPTMKPSAPIQAPPRAAAGRGHTHVGDLWCRFADKERIGIDVRSGAIAWRKEESEFGYHHTLEFVGDVAYSGDRGLSAYDLKTGELLWRQNFKQDTGWLSSSPRVVGDRVYVGSKDGALHVVDAGTGIVLLSHDIDFEPVVVLPLGTDRVVVGGHEEIACFGLS